MFTLSVIKAPKIDFYGRGSKDDYQKNWDLGLVYQNELQASMKNLAYALRRDENASQNNLLRWMICGSTPSDISDACIGAVNSLMCVSFIMRRLQPLLGERDSKDQSYTAYFRPNKRELNDLYREIEYARDFLWCIDMIYESELPAMNINSISLAPHAADRAAENQDRRKWVSWMKEIEEKAEKDVMIEFFQNKYCTIHEIERELEKYPEDFVGWGRADMVGDGLIEDGAATEDGATAEVGIKLRTKESNRWWVSPPAGSSKWGVTSQRCCQDRQRDH